MSVTQKPLPGADSKHFLAISYPLDWEKTHNSHGDMMAYPDKLLMNIFELAQVTPGSQKRKDWLAAFISFRSIVTFWIVPVNLLLPSL